MMSAAPEDLPVQAKNDDFPLSFAQWRLWFVDQLLQRQSTYNIVEPLRLSGLVDVGVLAAAVGELVVRHESLRTVFVEVDGQPRQRVVAPWPVSVEVMEVVGEAGAVEVARREALAPFDLGRGPLLRCRLLRLAERDHVLLVTMHHIVSDGWSWGVFWRELGVVYRALLAGRPSPLDPLPVQYADYAVWQRQWLTGEVLARQLGYWRQRLAGVPAVLELPADHVRPAVPR